MRQLVRISDPCMIDQYAVTTPEIANVEAIEAGKYFGMLARDRSIRKDNIIFTVSPDS